MKFWAVFLLGSALWGALVLASAVGQSFDRWITDIEMIRLGKPPAEATGALGFYEDKNVWNRIRVDAKGRVICSDNAKETTQ